MNYYCICGVTSKKNHPKSSDLHSFQLVTASPRMLKDKRMGLGLSFEFGILTWNVRQTFILIQALVHRLSIMQLSPSFDRDLKMILIFFLLYLPQLIHLVHKFQLCIHHFRLHKRLCLNISLKVLKGMERNVNLNEWSSHLEFIMFNRSEASFLLREPRSQLYIHV